MRLGADNGREGVTTAAVLRVPGRAQIRWCGAQAAGCRSGAAPGGVGVRGRLAVLDELIVVTGAVELPVPRPCTAWSATRLGRRSGDVAGRRRGRGRADGHHAVVVGLGDQPLVHAEAGGGWPPRPSTPIAVATYGGARRNPVRLAAEVWPLLPDAGDEGARAS